jgi:hypothetical protein
VFKGNMYTNMLNMILQSLIICTEERLGDSIIQSIIGIPLGFALESLVTNFTTAATFHFKLRRR